MPRLPLRCAVAVCLWPCLSFSAQPAPTVSTAPVPTHLLDRAWNAQWIAPPQLPARAYSVVHFRKHLKLETAPDRFVVHVSADNRYRLFVNGVPVHIGPARGDLQHWRFDSLDVAPFLQAGDNVLAAQVWNFGEDAPVAQVSARTAFILQGDGELEAPANTDASWTTFINPAYQPLGGMGAHLWTYIVVGPGDDLDAALYPWGWEAPDFDDTSWSPARALRPGRPRGTATDGIWALVPRQIPLMESDRIDVGFPRRIEGIVVPSVAQFISGRTPITVPPHTTARLLFDRQEHTTAYPQIPVDGGRGAKVTVTYAESLYEGPDSPGSKTKGNRNEIEGKNLRGFFDLFRPDGANGRVFRPLRWRTWRYLQLDIQTTDDPLILHPPSAEFTAYPLVQRGEFVSYDMTLQGVWKMCWRTLRTGTHDIFTDSAYYEQLTYVGDARIEALISVLVGGDDRLMRKTIEAFDHSRDASGLTASRWPDAHHQFIPPYSLVWISMVHDYWMLREDDAFVRARLGGVREVLRYFAEHSEPETGSYTGRRWWNYIDWIPAWGRDPVVGLGGVPPRDARGHSAILDLQHVYTLQQAAKLFAAFGFTTDAEACRARAARIRQFVVDQCWNEARGLIADTPDQQTFSQHANAYFILTAPTDAPGLTTIAERMLVEPDLTPATFYFSFYTHRALQHAGLGDRYLEQLVPWRRVLGQGLTTVPETPAPDSRSDAHAWGAHPMLGLLQTVLGVQPAEPGFRSVHIAPHLGSLPRASGTVPHPLGDIEVAYTSPRDGSLTAKITLPAGLTGTFSWQGQQRPLQPGPQTFTLKPAPPVATDP